MTRRGQIKHVPQIRTVAPPLVVDELVVLTRMRNQLLRAEVRLTLQIKAIARMLAGVRGHDVDHTIRDSPKRAIDVVSTPEPSGLSTGDVRYETAARAPASVFDEACGSPVLLAEFAAQPLTNSRDHVRAHRKQFDRRIVASARQLPAWSWVEQVRGFGPLGFGLLIGETGDLGQYANPAKLWKRLGLAVFDGRAQRRVAGNPEEAVRQGYSPQRRSLMHVIGEALIKQNREGAFRAVYLARKAYELARAPEMKPIAAHRRAMRYMEKRLIRELWRAWRAPSAIDAQCLSVPSQPASAFEKTA